MGVFFGWLLWGHGEEGDEVKAAPAPPAPSPGAGACPQVPAELAARGPILWRPFTPPNQSSAGGWVATPGKVYDPPIEVHPVARDDWDRSTPEKAYAGIFAANRSGDIDWMLATFAPSERQEMRAQMTAEAVEKNRLFMRTVVRELIRERIEYGPYVILITQSELPSGEKWGSPNPMIETPEGWALTNTLASDPFFSQVVWTLAGRYSTQK